jgi:perosamine synthetase
MYTGAKPVLVDAERNTWCVDVAKIEEKITKRTKAILPVHIYGHPCDMNPILRLARKYKLFVIEDAAEAHGAEYKGRKVGGIGDIGCFSFYANKIITTGEGGIVITNDKKIADKARLLKDLAFLPKKRFLHLDIGFNYRMTNIQAAIGVAQLKNINKFIKARRSNAKFYNRFLKGIKGLTLPKEKEWAKNVYWMYGILVGNKFGMSRNQLMSALSRKGIETRLFFIPIHKQPVFQKMNYFLKECYPISEELARSGLYLPSGSGLKEREIRYIAKSIKELKNG